MWPKRLGLEDAVLPPARGALEAVLKLTASAMELERLAGKLTWACAKLYRSGQLRDLAVLRVPQGENRRQLFYGSQAGGCCLSGPSSRSDMLAGEPLGW